jgi:hypothetical protein
MTTTLHEFKLLSYAERLEALQAEGDALKRLQAETAGRQGLHAPLDSLLSAFLDRAFKGEL